MLSSHALAPYQLAYLYGEFALRIAGVSNVSAARIG
jgi:hypothetical protein